MKWLPSGKYSATTHLTPEAIKHHLSQNTDPDFYFGNPKCKYRGIADDGFGHFDLRIDSYSNFGQRNDPRVSGKFYLENGRTRFLLNIGQMNPMFIFFGIAGCISILAAIVVACTMTEYDIEYNLGNHLQIIFFMLVFAGAMAVLIFFGVKNAEVTNRDIFERFAKEFDLKLEN